MSTPLPRRLSPVLALLASRTHCGLRPFNAGSAHTLAFSRPARRSLLFRPACSLSPLFGTFCTRGFDPGHYQPEPLRLLPVGATVTGWAIFLPLDQRALSTAHVKFQQRYQNSHRISHNLLLLKNFRQSFSPRNGCLFSRSILGA